MKLRELGNSGMEASVIALGTWVMGGWMWGGTEEKESIDAIHASLDAGVNLLDTAPIYGFGYSEEVVGRAIKDRRDQVILATKCGMRWDLEKGDYFFQSDTDGANEQGDKAVYKYLGPESIREEVERSLKRLQTDYIDLYQTHWQESTTPIEESMNELLKLKDEGKIRAVGVSNATPEQMKKYKSVGEIASDQEKYNMFQREIEEQGNTEYCAENDIAVLAYSPIAQGLLTGKFDKNTKFGTGDVRKRSPLFKPENILKVNQMLEDFRSIAEKHSINTLQLSLAWTFHQKGITHLLCGARNVKQAKENVKAGDVELSKEDIVQIDEIFSNYFN